MFKTILGADFHVRDDTPEELALGIQLLDDCGRLAMRHSTESVTIAGDMLHFKHRFSQELLTTLYDCLQGWQDRGVTFTILLGNHDQPDPERPGYSILKVFGKVANIITTPMLVEEDDCIVLLMPWFEPALYKKLLKEFASYAIGYTKPRILITHVSLQEGHVSPSNTRISAPIRLRDLYPSLWTGGVYLGDFHANQVLPGGRAMYLGAPRPTTFGDYQNAGVWLATTQGVELLPLLSRFPAFVSHRVDTIADLPLREYDTRDKHRIYCPLELMAHVETLYPGAKVLSIENEPIKGGERLSEVEKLDVRKVVKSWIKTKQLDYQVYSREAARLLT